MYVGDIPTSNCWIKLKPLLDKSKVYVPGIKSDKFWLFSCPEGIIPPFSEDQLKELGPETLLMLVIVIEPIPELS